MAKNVVIIGGGPAGIEAARNLARLGHTPILLEKSDRLGGHLARWDRLFPEGTSAASVLEAMLKDMEGVKYFTDTDITSINPLAGRYQVRLTNGISITADALLVTTGFELFDASLKQEYGYGIYDRVITNADLETYFQTRDDWRIQDPKVIGFVHCVGSRDEKVCNRQCSKVCCATAVKQAREIKQLFPEATVYCFYMDLRMFGRGYEDMYLNAQLDGVRFVRGRVSEVSENKDGRLFVKAEDTLMSKPLRLNMDLLVLMSGIVAPSENKEFARMLKIQLGQDGFFNPQNPIVAPTLSSRQGLFFAGTCTGPKTLPETLTEARAAAMQINEYLTEEKSGRLRFQTLKELRDSVKRDR